jgi:hypothetical protein
MVAGSMGWLVVFRLMVLHCSFAWTFVVGEGPHAQHCKADSQKYWALDTPNNECAEACLDNEIQKVEFWILTGGQGRPTGNISSPCADHGFHTFNRTDVLGYGKLQISLDKYLPDSNDQSQPKSSNDKCALKCTLESIGVYWGCAAVCIEKQAPDSCITAGCLATVTAYDVKCLHGCNKTAQVSQGLLV